MTQKIDDIITDFIQKSLLIGDLDPMDKIYTTNRLLDLMHKKDYTTTNYTFENKTSRLEILDQLVDYAVNVGIIEDMVASRDVFSAKIMDLITLSPREVNEKFRSDYKNSPVLATDNFYEMSKRNDYIKTREISQNIEYFYQSERYGDLQITINLSKPEKDPKEIALAREKQDKDTYPANALVVENEGYAGHLTHAGRSSHRIVRLNLFEEEWGLQYSPYAYYNEHSIFLALKHRPMKISKDTFVNLMEIVRQFPHYFVGSNADLPIVGGSILSQDHYQSGRHHFPIEDARYIYQFESSEFNDVDAGIINWPMSTIRLRSNNVKQLIELSSRILEKWIEYSDESVDILAYTKDERHNTVTPIVRKRQNQYEIDIVLRNNRTTTQYPDGIFHPHQKVQHIKKENIGLIEVMGLAILPGRLKTELEEVESFLLDKNAEVHPSHLDWANDLKAHYQPKTKEEARQAIEEGVGETFIEVLEDAGVFKADEKGQRAFIKFIEQELIR